MEKRYAELEKSMQSWETKKAENLKAGIVGLQKKIKPQKVCILCLPKKRGNTWLPL